MTHDELVHSLELERMDRTFWRLPNPSTRVSASKRDERIAAIAAERVVDAKDAERHRAELLAEVGPELWTVGGKPCGPLLTGGQKSSALSAPVGRSGIESSTSIGAA